MSILKSVRSIETLSPLVAKVAREKGARKSLIMPSFF
jgi:hypothetical protein